MGFITIEPALSRELLAARELVEVRDCEGNVIGHFMPLYRQPDAETVRTMFDLDKARETLRQQYNRGRPLSEICAELHSRETDG